MFTLTNKVVELTKMSSNVIIPHYLLKIKNKHIHMYVSAHAGRVKKKTKADPLHMAVLF